MIALLVDHNIEGQAALLWSTLATAGWLDLGLFHHLAQNPYVSLAYITEIVKPVYVDCTAAWVDDIAQKQRVWELFKQAPPPLGFDPAHDFVSPEHEHFGLLKLTPWRIALVSFPAESHYAGQRIWHRRDGT